MNLEKPTEGTTDLVQVANDVYFATIKNLKKRERETMQTEIISFTLRLPPISKKNSQQILINSVTGRPFIFPSRQYKEYERNSLLFIPKLTKPIDYAVNVKCIFYMPTRRKCDLTNLLEAIDDIMVKSGLLSDDNFTIIESHDGSRVLYDKENPRTEVQIVQIKKGTIQDE